jgi:hypothetical protein
MNSRTQWRRLCGHEFQPWHWTRKISNKWASMTITYTASPQRHSAGHSSLPHASFTKPLWCLSSVLMRGVGLYSIFTHDATSSLRVPVSSPRAESVPRLSYMENEQEMDKSMLEKYLSEHIFCLLEAETCQLLVNPRQYLDEFNITTLEPIFSVPFRK